MTQVEDKVGSMLKTARIKKKLELEDVAKKLCIRRVYLDAIENSDYEEIPDYPYGPGFVRSYADFLGLNGTRLVQVFREEVTPKDKKAVTNYQAPELQIEAAVPSQKYIVISILLIVAIYLGWFSWDQYNNHLEAIAPDSEVITVTTDDTDDTILLSMDDYADTTTSASTEGDNAVPVVEVVEDTVENTPQVTFSEDSFIEDEIIEEPKQEETTKMPKGVFLKINQEAWVEVRDNDKLYLSKVLKPGDTYALPKGGKNMHYSVGRYGAVDVFIDGKLTEVATPAKKTNINLNEFLNN